METLPEALRASLNPRCQTPSLSTEIPTSRGETWRAGCILLKIKVSFIEMYLTYNKLHTLKVYNVVKFWHMYVPGTHHHNQNNKHIHHPVNFRVSSQLRIPTCSPGRNLLEGCNSLYGH